jgi:hypothetical protein
MIRYAGPTEKTGTPIAVPSMVVFLPEMEKLHGVKLKHKGYPSPEGMLNELEPKLWL